MKSSRVWKLVVLSSVALAALGAFVVPAVAGSSSRPDTRDPRFVAAMKEAQVRAAAWDARRQAAASPQAVAASQSAYAAESPSDALTTADAKFPGVMTSAVYTHPPLASGEQVASYGDHQALISAPNGRRAVLVSPTLPLIGSTPSGSRAPIDLRLVQAGGAFRAASSGAAVSLPAAGSGEVRFLDKGFGFSLVGADSQPAQLSHDRLFYGDVEGASNSVDAVLAARQTGAEYSLILRSASSPMSQSLRFSLPAGGRLELAGSGPGQVVKVLGASGQPLAVALPAWGSDAVGSPVPVSYSVDGDTLTLHVSPSSSTVFPAFVDPLVASWDPGMYGPWSFSSTPAGEFVGGDSGGFTYTQDANLNVGTPGDSGLWEYRSLSGAYIYEMYSYDVWNYYSGDDEAGGLFGFNSYFNPGTWADTGASGPGSGPGGSGGPYAFRGQYAAEAEINTDYCAAGSTGGANGGCPVPSHTGVVQPNNLAETAYDYLVNPPTATVTVGVYGDWLYESDDVPPVVTVAHSGYTPGTWVNSFTDTITATGTTTGNSTGPGLGMYSLTVGPPVNQTTYNSGGSYPWPATLSQSDTISSSSLPEGSSTITASAGTISGESGSTSWTTLIDRTPPTVSVSCPGSGSWSNMASVTCTITGSDPNNASNGTAGSGLRTLQYQTQFNNGAWSGWTSVSSGATTAISAEGVTNVRAQAIDNAGNTTTTPVSAVELDRTAPNVSAGCPAGWFTTGQTCTITGSDPVNASNGTAGSGLKTLQYQTANGQGTYSGYTPVSSGYQTTLSREGANPIQAQSIDNASNSATDSKSACVDNLPATTQETGTLWNQVVLAGQNTLNINATDGTADGIPADQRSGVKSITTTIVENATGRQWYGPPPTGPASTPSTGTVGCLLGTDASGVQNNTVDTSTWPAGQYTITVTVPNNAGVVKTDTSTFDLVSSASPAGLVEGIVGSAVTSTGDYEDTCTSPSQTVADGYAGSTYLRVRLQPNPTDSSQNWTCFEGANSSESFGGRVDVGTSAGAPTTDSNWQACNAYSAPVSGGVGPESFSFNTAEPGGTNQVWICTMVGGVGVRVIQPVDTANPPVAVHIDSSRQPPPTPTADPYPSGACQSGALGTPTQLANIAGVDGSQLWLYEASPSSGGQASMCARFQGLAGGAGAAITVTGPGVTVGPTSDHSQCTTFLGGLNSPQTLTLWSSPPGQNPAFVCFDNNGTWTNYTAGTGSPGQLVTITPDPGTP